MESLNEGQLRYYKKLGYRKIVVKEDVLFVYERPSDIEGYVECIYFDGILRQFMANEVSEEDGDDIFSKYLTLEELEAINLQIAELGWSD